MIAKVEQVTTDENGNLALLVSYWDGAAKVNAERLQINVPRARLTPYRNAAGNLERLDGVAVLTPEDMPLAQQIGIKQVIATVDGQFVADFAIARAKAFASVHRQAAGIVAQTAAATDAQLMGMAAGRVVQWTQVAEVAQINADDKEHSHALERLALAQRASTDAAFARMLANKEIERHANVLLFETPWPVGNPDPRGYLDMPEVLAIAGTEHEC